MLFPNKKAQEKWNISIIVAFLVILFGALILILFTGWGHNMIKNTLGCEGWFSGMGLEETYCVAANACPSGAKEEKGIFARGCGKDSVCCKIKKGEEKQEIMAAIDENGKIMKPGQARYEIAPGSAKFYFLGTGNVFKCTAMIFEGNEEVKKQEIEDCRPDKKGTIEYDFKAEKDYRLELKGYASSAEMIAESNIRIVIAAKDEDLTDEEKAQDRPLPKILVELVDQERELSPGTQYYTQYNLATVSVECEKCEIKLNDEAIEGFEIGAISEKDKPIALREGFNTIQYLYFLGEIEWKENYLINYDSTGKMDSYIIFNVATCLSEDISSCNYLQPDMVEEFPNPESSFITERYLLVEYSCFGAYINCKIETVDVSSIKKLEPKEWGFKPNELLLYDLYDMLGQDGLITVEMIYTENDEAKKYGEKYTIEYMNLN